MSSKGTTVPVSFRTALSVLCLLLYSAGFIRVEVKFNDHEERLLAVEEVISQMTKHRKAVTSAGAMGNSQLLKEPRHKEESTNKKLHRVARHLTNNQPFNTSANMKQVLEDVVTSSFKKICQNTGTWNVCPRGLTGPPGREGPKGDKGNHGRRGKKGMMGQPGRSGKQGIMGPLGMRGEKGVKGDIGAPGIPGMKGEPGESISSPKVTVSHLTVNESNTAVLLCSVSGNPVPQLAWSRVGGVFPSNRTKVSSEGLLQINKVRLEDAGTYKCVARNILGREEKRASLVVESQPKISLSFGPSYVIKGKNITLPVCHVTGFPSPKISWRKVPGNLVQARTLQKDGRLSIQNAQKSDSGLYKCEASNNLGLDSAVTQLNVVELARFTVSPPSQLEVSTVQNITVRCQAAGDPQPTITWRKEGGKLPAGRSSVSADGTLKIWNLREEDSGKYSCVASSDEIFKAAFSTLKVTVKKPGCVPLGVASTSTIPDARMTASSYFDRNYYKAYYGRLNGSRGFGAWCTKTKADRTDYLQVDMGNEYSVCAVATQGPKNDNAWTTSYKIHFSSKAVTWNTYTDNNVDRVFTGNQDKNTVVKHSLRRNVKARFVRFYPVSHYTHPCLRVEIFVLKNKTG